MLTDRQGNTLSNATPEVVALFDQAVEAFNIYRGDPVALVDSALAAAPDFAMAHILKAYLFGFATEPEATVEAKEITARAKALPLNEREKSHVAALDLLLDGGWTAAALALDTHNVRFPRDLVALQAGHLTDFYRANARNIRDRIARALPHWSPDVPGYSFMLGMHAFGLEETGDYARAEEAGRQAIDLQPLDCWAHHAVAHVMEMQGRAEDGVGWMIAREPYWSGEDNFFKVHNWWHQVSITWIWARPIRCSPSTTDRSAKTEAPLPWISSTAPPCCGGCRSPATTWATAGKSCRKPGISTRTESFTPSTTGTRS